MRTCRQCGASLAYVNIKPHVCSQNINFSMMRPPDKGCSHGDAKYLHRCEAHQIEDLKAENERLKEALEEILIFYNHITVKEDSYESMAKLAQKALAKCEKK